MNHRTHSTAHCHNQPSQVSCGEHRTQRFLFVLVGFLFALALEHRLHATSFWCCGRSHFSALAEETAPTAAQRDILRLHAVLYFTSTASSASSPAGDFSSYQLFPVIETHTATSASAGAPPVSTYAVLYDTPITAANPLVLRWEQLRAAGGVALLLSVSSVSGTPALVTPSSGPTGPALVPPYRFMAPTIQAEIDSVAPTAAQTLFFTPQVQQVDGLDASAAAPCFSLCPTNAASDATNGAAATTDPTNTATEPPSACCIAVLSSAIAATAANAAATVANTSLWIPLGGGADGQFQLRSFDVESELWIPRRWLSRWSSGSSGSAASTATSSSAASSLVIPVVYRTNLPSVVKQGSVYALCTAIGVAAVATGGGGWVCITSLQTLLLSVTPSRCAEPFTHFYFDGTHRVLVAPTAAASDSLIGGYAVTIAVIALGLAAHAGLVAVYASVGDTSFFAASRVLYFPLVFLMAVSYLWIHLTADTFRGMTSASESPLVKMSFAVTWLGVALVTAFVWHDALRTGHDGYYVPTKVSALAVLLRKYRLRKDLPSSPTGESLADVAGEAIAPTSTTAAPQATPVRRRASSPAKQAAVVAAGVTRAPKDKSMAALDRELRVLGAMQSLPLHERLAYTVLGRFAFVIIPEGSWPLTRGYATCRGLFTDRSCSFAFLIFIFMTVVAAVSDNASCAALYLNTGIVQFLFLVVFALIRPFRVPLLNVTWVVIKAAEICLNALLYAYVVRDGPINAAVANAIPFVAVLVAGLNAAFTMYAVIVTFSERSVRNRRVFNSLLHDIQSTVRGGTTDGSSQPGGPKSPGFGIGGQAFHPNAHLPPYQQTPLTDGVLGPFLGAAEDPNFRYFKALYQERLSSFSE